MPPWAIHLIFDLFFGAWCLMIGIGISADVKRFIHGRQKPGQRTSECLGRALH
jgi:hypothetical protein